MLDASARLLRLLSLLQGRRSWSGAELAERLDVTPRTLRRDVEKLRELGYDLSSTGGPGGGYVFGDGSDLPLLLGEDEAVTAAVALRTAVQSAEGEGERVLGVLVKLEQLMPERLRERVAALQTQTVAVGWAGHPVDAGLLAVLAAACRDSEAVRLRYRAREGAAAERTVYPLRLAHTGSRRWYLLAWDPARADWRTFRVDRIEAIVAVGPRVVRPDPPDDVGRYVSASIASVPWPCRGRVALDGSPDELAGVVPAWLGGLTAGDPGRSVLEVKASTWDGVIGQLVMIGVPFELLDPPELAEHLGRVADRLAARAAASRDPG